MPQAVAQFIGERFFMDKRRHMGKDKEGVIFPVAPNLSEMSDGYLEFINEIKEKIKKQRMAAYFLVKCSWNR